MGTWRDKLSPEAKEKHKSTPVVEEPAPSVEAPPSTEPIQLKDLAPAAPYDDKPEVTSIGLARVKGGYVVCLVKSQGHHVHDTEILSGPDPRPLALERLKLMVVKKLFIEAKN